MIRSCSGDKIVVETIKTLCFSDGNVCIYGVVFQQL